VLAISSELGDNKENLKALANAFNAKDNAYGEYVGVFLASQGYNEGIDLKAVRHIHIFEPLLTFASDQQTIGRAARYCSHSDLDQNKGEWTVRIHRYISQEPKDMSIFNINYYNERIEYFGREIQRMEETLKTLPKGASDTKAALKADITYLKDELNALGKKRKEIEKMNLQNVQMVDEQIGKEAMERTMAMMRIYDAMKRASIDFLLLRDFHGLR
jgi:hypothetical protein